MPWGSKTVEKLRMEFVSEAQTTENFSALCREFGITRRTGYLWLERYNNGDELSDKSKKPLLIANKTSPEIENLIISLRKANPGWGARKLKVVLENQGYENIPCAKTLNNILSRNGYISKEDSLKHHPYKRFEKESCNELWQTDFKGEFKMRNNKYCFPLDILDDHSRFLIALKACPSTKNVVIPTFEAAFREYGMPNSILSDNGAQFAGFKHGFTRFEKWLMDLNILPIHGRIVHPQTQGKIERFHRTMDNELISRILLDDLVDADNHFCDYRIKYNEFRPHEALGMKCPQDIYIKSKREYIEKIPEYEYGGQYHVIKVNSWGYVRFGKWQIYLSETMVGNYIEFRPDEEHNSFIACYRNFKIAEFSMVDGMLLNRNISRL